MRPSIATALAPALLAAVLSGCGAAACPDVATPSPGAYVRGRVDAGSGGTPLEAAQVTATDAQGNAVAGVAHARTDAQGDYLAAQLPTSTAFVLEARGTDAQGKETVLKTLARAGADPNAFTDLSAATTILTAALTQGATGMPGAFDLATYARAVDLVNQKLATTPAPALTDAAAMAAWLSARTENDQTLRTAVETLKGQVGGGTPRDAVETEVRAANPDPDPLDALKPVY